MIYIYVGTKSWEYGSLIMLNQNIHFQEQNKINLKYQKTKKKKSANVRNKFISASKPYY